MTQISEGEDRYRIEIALEGDGLPRQTAVSEFDFPLSAQDREDLRWYLEDYLQYPQDPAPKIAARIEGRMIELGTALFKDVFQSNDDASDLWAALRSQLNDTRVEIATGVEGANAIPWELIRDPKTDARLALRAKSFVRSYSQAAQRPKLPKAAKGPIRILLVICRPAVGKDVPFRSVASRIVKGLSEEARARFRLDVLRPPTFEQLGRTLRAAKDRGEPYHVVHFDGHGTYAELEDSGELGDLVGGLSKLVLAGSGRPRPHGYLLFENPAVKENAQLVGGPFLGKLLVETDVPILVLNACRSAHAESPNAPDSAAEAKETEVLDQHSRVRAFGSLAQEVMDAGVVGVVAMRYNVYVVTAAQFVADLYAALTQGQTLDEAATLGRKLLHDQPLREIAYEPRPLQDWPVPVVYGAASMPLFPRPKAEEKLKIEIGRADVMPERGMLDPRLPPKPDTGFFGRDETLLALDRAFDSQRIVLLHAYAGNGKTATVAEFGRWYSLTGGVDGPVLFTSFEQYNPLARVLDKIGDVFGGMLEGAGVHWLTLTDEQRRDAALQILKIYPVLWIWDNVESVAGFPSGLKSDWSYEEQKELSDFLRDARDTKAKFLLTSRRDESGWLGDLPARILVPPMPMQDRVELARAVAERRGRRFMEVEDWTPLLGFTQGNPLTITVLVGQALRDGLETKEEIERFVAELQAGTAEIEEDKREGRSKSLGASLRYGFEHAFDEEELKRLALLHLFQGFVNVGVLQLMGAPEMEWTLPEVRGLTRDRWILLLDRAAEVGLLSTHGGGYYSVHPALPWYFRGLFEERYPSDEGPARAFVGAVRSLGNYYWGQYEHGDKDVIGAIAAEERNLLHARRLALERGWMDFVLGPMQGLLSLYDQTGRRAEWRRLVEEIVPRFVDAETGGGPLLGLEDQWCLVTEYRVRIAREMRQWVEAMRLQSVLVDLDRQRAADALAKPPEELGGYERGLVRSLAVSLERLGSIQREQGLPECVESYEESLDLTERIGETVAPSCAFNLGHAYYELAKIRDLDRADRWLRHSLKLAEELHHSPGQGKCWVALGLVASKRFNEARAARKSPEDQLRLLNNTLQSYQKALKLIPPNSVHDLAAVHNALGEIYRNAGDIGQALVHYREAIRYFEKMGEFFNAAQTRHNVALALAGAGRFSDALDYAEAALRNYETYDESAAAEMQGTRKLIAKIEQSMKSQW